MSSLASRGRRRNSKRTTALREGLRGINQRFPKFLGGLARCRMASRPAAVHALGCAYPTGASESAGSAVCWLVVRRIFYDVLDFDGSEMAFGLDIGCLGPCAGGRSTQTFVHREFDQPEPRGWRTQIRNELSLVLWAGARAPFWRLNRHMDLRPGVALRLGNVFTDLTADATLRAGRLEPLAGVTGLYLFARGSTRAVAYDTTLEGGMFSDDQVRTLSLRRVTGEWELGLQWYERSWAWRLSIVRRGNDIAGLPESQGRQDFVRLSITYFP